MNPAYAFTVPGGAAADRRAQAAALKETGELKVKTANILVIILADALEPPDAHGDVIVPQHLLQYVLVPTVEFTSVRYIQRQSHISV